MSSQLNPVSPASFVNLGKVVRTTGQTCVVDRNNLVDTTSAVATVKLPTVYTDETIVLVEDLGGNASINAITVDGNGQNIDGLATVGLTLSYGALAFARDAKTNQWRRMLLPRQRDGAADGVRLYSAADLAQAFGGILGTQIGSYAQRPVAPASEGARYLATDSVAEWIGDTVDGALAWRPLILARMGYEPPSVAGFTNYSNAGIMGAQTPSNSLGSILNVFSNYNNVPEEVRLTTKAMPAGAFTQTLYARVQQNFSGTMFVGCAFRQSSNGSVEIYALRQTGGTFTIARHRATASNNGTSPNYTFDSEVISPTPLGTSGVGGISGIWLRITDDRAGVRRFYYSFDGTTFFEAVTFAVAGNAFLTADQAGFSSWVSSHPAGTGTLGGVFSSFRVN